ncbi:MAG: hypothetical protein ACM3XO_19575, partial [Bacteroidota bacterium]
MGWFSSVIEQSREKTANNVRREPPARCEEEKRSKGNDTPGNPDDVRVEDEYVSPPIQHAASE